MALLSVNDYPDVRRALDATLTATLLPDSVIGSPIYLGEAERRVIARLPEAASLTGVQAITARVATIYLLAALVAPVVPLITREQDKDYSYNRAEMDWSARASQLQADADTLLGGLAGDAVETEATTTAGWLFGLASADRGQ